MYMTMSLSVSTPPVITMSDWPSASSLTPAASAARELAQAASVVQFVPCRSNLFAIRPATTLLSRPGNEASCHGT
jgi:hypothetical protein